MKIDTNTTLVQETSRGFKKKQKILFQLAFQEISVQTKSNGHVILHKCSGRFPPKSFTALIGPSGCGKTTFMSVLAGRNIDSSLEYTGQLYVNSHPTDNMNDYSCYIGFVLQEDLLLPTFTPRQSFQFIVKLKMPKLNGKQIEKKVQQTIQKLGLKSCADTYVGNNLLRGISGGERKRTIIGIQLLINPKILFLDQPTTGLDSASSLNLISYIKTIAAQGCTVVTTIHQPSSGLYAQFDEIMLMCQGHQIFHGKKDQASQMFESLGYKLPPYTNPSDFYMKLLNKEGLSNVLQKSEAEIKAEYETRIQKFKQYFLEHNKDDNLKFGLKNKLDVQEIKTAGWFYTTYLVFYRSYRASIRNSLEVPAKLFLVTFQAVLGALIYYQKDDDPIIQQRNLAGALFYIILNTYFQSVLGNVGTFLTQRQIFLREKMSNLYSTSNFYIGMVLASTPLNLLIVLIFTVIGFFSYNFVISAQQFFVMLAIGSMMFFANTAFGIFWGAIIRNLQAVLNFMQVILGPFNLVNGYVSTEIPRWLVWLQAISINRYAFTAYLRNEYREISICKNVATNMIYQCDYVAFNYPHNNLSLWLSFGLICIIWLSLHILALIITQLTSTTKPQPLLPPRKGADQNY